jgi:hypothetical protein
MAEHMNLSRPSRAASVSSAGTNTSGTFSFVPRYTPRPEPAYISATAAAEHVTHNHRHESYDLLSPAASPTNDGAIFSDSALSLLNSFLDSLLYNFLAKARGTNLTQLRPAIVEVLKARLGREALASADEELHGLVGEGDSENEEDGDAIPRPSSTTPDWHLESAFKRMRLRVMVFIRLGDFDDEDEDRFVEDDEFSERGPHALEFGLQSSPAPVYLASVLEYLAEQILSLAGEAAYARARTRTRRVISENQPLDVSDAEEVVIEDRDVEKIALNPALGRLWRTWLKSYRGIIGASPGRPLSSSRRGSGPLSSPTRLGNDMHLNSTLRRDSTSGVIQEERETPVQELPNPHENIPEGEPSETDIAANIPLPMSEQDVDEIEVPGLATLIYDEGEEVDEDDVVVEEPKRPRSVSFVLPGAFTPAVEDANKEANEEIAARPAFRRQRSNSVPTAIAMPWGWMPASIRKLIERLAGASDDELLEYAASIPLPQDDQEPAASVPSEVDQTEAVLTSEKNEDDAADSDNYVSAPETVIATPDHRAQAEYIESPEDDEKDAESAQLAESGTESAKNERLSTGAIATGIVGAAGAAVLTAAASRHSANPSLEVQTKEVFEPEDADLESNRGSRGQIPPIVTTEEGSKSSSRQSLIESPVTNRSSKDSKLSYVKEPSDSLTPTAKPASEAPRVYRPASSKVKDLINKVNGSPDLSKPAHIPPRNESRRFPVVPSSGYTPRRTTPEPQQPGGYTPRRTTPEPQSAGALTPRRTTPEPQRNSLEPQQPVQSLEQPAVKAVDSPIKSASSSAAPSKPEDQSPISPLDEGHPIVQQTQEQQRLARDGPPKPPTVTAANPYAMLYDDVEPEAIGVAKTSNIPIHSTTPSTSAEQRPWTPNRGLPAVKKNISSPESTNPNLDKPTSSFSERNRPVPSPLRSVAADSDANGSRDVPKTVVSHADEYDLDRPINPERFRDWNRPKESPTIPRFFTQQTSTPTESEHRRGSVSQGSNRDPKHSPKGSQGSTGTKDKREEEVAKERKFEALLVNKEPIKYTLTPEEIRDSGVSRYVFSFLPVCMDCVLHFPP